MSNEFKCVKRGHNQYYKGRKCFTAGADNAATSCTMFYKSKFRPLSAFEMAFSFSVLEKGFTCELGKEFGCKGDR